MAAMELQEALGAILAAKRDQTARQVFDALRQQHPGEFSTTDSKAVMKALAVMEKKGAAKRSGDKPALWNATGATVRDGRSKTQEAKPSPIFPTLGQLMVKEFSRGGSK